MKKDNRGFMLVEALVMSTVIIGVIVYMFIQFQSLSKNYDKSFHYNTVSGLYVANEVRNYLIDTAKLDDLVTSLGSGAYVSIDYSETTWTAFTTAAGINQIIFAEENLSELKGKNIEGISPKFRDYINYLKVYNNAGIYRILIEFTDETYASLRIEVSTNA